jgi:hypothetical protein
VIVCTHKETVIFLSVKNLFFCQNTSLAPPPKRMKGLCFICVARDHKITFCHDPTRCWRCRQFNHTSSKCRSSSPEQSLSGLPDLNLGSAPTPTHNSRDTDTTIDNNLLHIAHNSHITICERLLGLMLLEPLLIN